MVGSSPSSNVNDRDRPSGLMVECPISLTAVSVRVYSVLMPGFCAGSVAASSRLPKITGKTCRILLASCCYFTVSFRCSILPSSASFTCFTCSPLAKASLLPSRSPFCRSNCPSVL